MPRTEEAGRPVRAPRKLSILLLALLVAGLAACQPLKPVAYTPARVVIWGDSFGEQVAPLLPYEARVFGGTAPCTFLNEMRLHAAAGAPEVAVLLFAGTNASACTGGTTSQYPRDMAEAVRILSSAGSRVLVLAAPCWRDGPNAMNAAYEAVGIQLVWGPHDSVCGPGGTWIDEYRQGDGHLSPTGVQRFVQEIEAAVGD